MTRRRVRVFQPQAERVGVARRFARTTAQRWGCGALQDEAQLVTSELATNAVVHAETPFAVCIRQGKRGLVIEVSDDNPVVPTALFGNTRTDTGGLGLGLVAASADAWGVRRRPHGKTIWARLRPVNKEETMENEDRPYADPQDLAFGKAAKEKEETLDEQRFDGDPSEPLEGVEEHEEPPRPAGKADPAE